MRCNEAKSKMAAYFDGELDTESSLAIASHTGQCTICREYLTGLQNIDELIRGLPRVEVSQGFSRQVVARAKKWDELAVGRRPAPSAFASFLQVFEDLLDVVLAANVPAINTLDEFGDFPPLSLGCIYFQILGQSLRG